MSDLTKQDLELLFDALEYLETACHRKLEEAMMVVGEGCAHRGDTVNEAIKAMKRAMSSVEPELRSRRERIAVIRAKIVGMKDRLEASSAWDKAMDDAKEPQK